MTDHEPSTERREVLRAVGVVGGLTLSGCIGGGGGTTGSDRVDGTARSGPDAESDGAESDGTDGGGTDDSAGAEVTDGPGTDDGSAGGAESGAGDVLTPGGASFSLSSSAFEDGGEIPTRFTCEGENVSPRLEFGDLPDDVTALALVVDDPDTPRDLPFVHWLLWNVPPDVEALPEGVPAGETVESLGGARQGTNDAGRVGYTGPCPPTGDGPHTYRFMLFALEAELDLDPGADRSAVDAAIRDVAVGGVALTGTYQRE